MNLDELSQYFHLPINEVSQQLGVCTTVLKKMCRNNGLERWPHRKIKSIDGLIESLEELISSKPNDIDKLEEELTKLKENRKYILANPNVSYKEVVPKHVINNLNTRIQKGDEMETTSKASTTSSPKKSSPQIDVLKHNSPTKTIVKKTYGTRSKKNGNRSLLDSSQENLVVRTLADIIGQREDLVIFNDFLQVVQHSKPSSYVSSNEYSRELVCGL